MPWGSNEALLLSIIEKNEAVFAVSGRVLIGFGSVLAVFEMAKSRSALAVKRFIGETRLRQLRNDWEARASQWLGPITTRIQENEPRINAGLARIFLLGGRVLNDGLRMMNYDGDGDGDGALGNPDSSLGLLSGPFPKRRDLQRGE